MEENEINPGEPEDNSEEDTYNINVE